MTTPINILITLPFNDELINRISSVSPRLNLILLQAHTPEEIPGETWEKVEVLYTNRILPAPEQVPHLVWIQFHWAGVDHALDAPILRHPNLVATTLSGASASQMAEHALLMMLALGHHLPEAHNYQSQGEWPKARWDTFNPLELRGSTVGIVGYGSIGRQIARLLINFGATVLATKRDAMHPEDQGYIVEGWGDPAGDFVHRLYPPQALRSMLRECDYVVITLPLTRETRGLIGADELAALKPGAYLVDIGRGAVIDHTALVACLRDHKIAGAALDVFPAEPLPPDSPLWRLPHVIITPHIAGFTPHYDERAVDLFCANLQRFLAGLPLFNLLDLGREY